MPVLLMRYLPYILPLLIIGYAGWDIRGRVDAKIISDIRIEQAEAESKAKTKTLATEREWAIKLSEAGATSAKAINDKRDRYDAARLHDKGNRVVVSSAPACAIASNEAANSDGLSGAVGVVEVTEGQVRDTVLEPADMQTLSLIECQAYINIIHNKQP